MDDSPQTQTFKPKRKSRLRLIVLLSVLAAMVMVYLPLRTGRANDRLKQSLLAHDAEGVRHALDNGADSDFSLKPALPESSLGSLPDFVRLVLRRSLRRPANNARTALMYAAGNRDTEIVSELLRHSANVNLRTDSGYSALLYAASGRTPQIVEALLAKGSDVHVHTRDGTTALLAAAKAGQTQNVRLLLAKGEDIHETDMRFHTALSLAAENRHEETIRFLLSQGADERDLYPAHPSQNVPARRFTSAGPSLTIITDGVTLVVPGRQTLRLKSQPFPPVTTAPLLFAAKYASPSLVQFLWPRTDTDVRQQVGWELACTAAASGQIEVMRFLLSRSVPVNPPRNIPSPVRQPGRLRSDYDTGVYTPLHYAAALQAPEIAALLIAHGANVNAEDMSGTTPLLAAVSGSHLATVRLLIEHGANVQAAERISGQNALMRGVSDAKMARLLLDHGLNPNARDRSGRTALMQCYTLPVVALLIERGAEVDVRDSQGNTALLTATRSLQTEIAALLLKHGANANRANRQGETPLSAARALRSKSLIALLTDAGAKR